MNRRLCEPGRRHKWRDIATHTLTLPREYVPRRIELVDGSGLGRTVAYDVRQLRIVVRCEWCGAYRVKLRRHMEPVYASTLVRARIERPRRQVLVTTGDWHRTSPDRWRWEVWVNDMGWHGVGVWSGTTVGAFGISEEALRARCADIEREHREKRAAPPASNRLDELERRGVRVERGEVCAILCGVVDYDTSRPSARGRCPDCGGKLEQGYGLAAGSCGSYKICRACSRYCEFHRDEEDEAR